jgi:hypothetical protein
MQGKTAYIRAEVVGPFPGPCAEMQGKMAYIRAEVVGPFPGPCASESYVHQAALFYIVRWGFVNMLYICYFAMNDLWSLSFFKLNGR